MRRILHIIDSLGRHGRAKQLLVLCQGLVQQGFEVYVAALEGRGVLEREFTAAGISTTELNRRWPQDPIAYFRPRRLIWRLRPNVVHIWDFDAGIFGRVAARSAGVRNLVAGQHHIDPHKSGLKWCADLWLAKYMSRYIASSAHVRDWCISHGLPAEKIAVIPPGVSPAAVGDVSRGELLRDLQLPADARLIGVVGRLVPEKRVKDLIWAADLLRVLHDNLRLLIIGDGPQRPLLEQYARLASDLDHIRFLGEGADVWRIMPHLDVLWNGSENRGPSIAILEAMAAGVPVIASDTPMNRDFIVEGQTGYLISLGSRAGRAARARYTDQIFTDPELATRLAAASRQRIAEHFNADRMIQQYADAYRDI